MSASPNLRLPYIDPNQNQKSVTHNAALTMLDALVQTNVQSAALTAPPSAPADGQCWIVAAGATGAWAGRDAQMAAWQDGAWAFYPPNKGAIAFVDALGSALIWNGSAWGPLLGALTQLSLGSLGIGTAADAGNPLSAKLNAALLAALGTGAGGSGDVRLTLSKQAPANTASIVFQDGFSGRAEIGLAGDDSLRFKVSPDGTSFVDAMDIAPTTGAVSFAQGPTAPTPPAGDASGKLATTAFVAGTVAPAPLDVLARGAAGATTALGVLETLVTLSGATTVAPVSIPAGAIVFAVSSRVVAAVAGAPGFDIGTAGSATLFAAGLATSAGSTNAGAITPTPFPAATTLVLTATSGSFTSGSVRLAIHYAACGAPAS